MRKLIVSVSVALAAAACGGSTQPASTATESIAAPQTTEATSSQPTTTVEPSATTADPAPEGGEESDAAETAEPAAPSFDGPPAPDFELELSDGSTFRLSDEQKPVYIVFWAEW
jgi:hypothetical protein